LAAADGGVPDGRRRQPRSDPGVKLPRAGNP